MRSHHGSINGENSMQSLSQHRSRRGGTRGGMARTVLHGESGASAKVPQRLTRSARAVRPSVIVPVRAVPPLAALAHEQRSQLQALTAAGVTSPLRQGVEGRTRLASLLPVRESILEAGARREVRRVFTLHRPLSLAVLVERS